MPPDPERQVDGNRCFYCDGRIRGEPAVDHLGRWCARNAGGAWTAALETRLLPHDVARTQRVAAWAYSQAARTQSTV